MDLERIKQNLRLRSGRSSKPKKPRPKATKPSEAAVPNGAVPTPPKPTQDSNPAPSSKEQPKEVKKQDDAFDLASDTKRDPPPSTPQAATGAQEDTSKDKTPHQNGSSGLSASRESQSKKEEASAEVMNDQQKQNADSSDAMDFDLKAPARKQRPPSVETLSELLFSAGHLNTILHNPQDIAKFTAFLIRFKPDYQPLILRYLETQKAIKAIEYANAVAEGATVAEDKTDEAVEKALPSVAATLDKSFEEASITSFEALVGEALPMYITYNLTKLVTECLINEITGKQTPMMRNMVDGLSEVFCLTDPNQEDNPIIYASEEFYRFTGYGSDDVIDNNCRFLQGRKTNPKSPKRLGDTIRKGEAICETLLNYKRDGRPFINLLLIAPLHDDKGKLKYFIGAQVDVTGLVEDGRALDAFERYLALRQLEKENNSTSDPESKKKQKALKKLRELSEMFDLEESAVVQTASRASSMSRGSDAGSSGGSERRRGNRRVFTDDDDDDEDGSDQDDADDEDAGAWKLGSSGSGGLSGKLPGIYETYMLIRPAPSSRIVFVSPKLRKIGKVVQSPFLSHVAAPAATLAGLKESFASGTPVSAKINFLPQAGESRNGTKTGPGYKHEDGKNGRACWISATPLVGNDDRIGVWMVVVVVKSKAQGTARVAAVEAKATSKSQAKRPNKIEMPKDQTSNRGRPNAPQVQREELPIKPIRLDDSDAVNGNAPSTPTRNQDAEEDNGSSTPRHSQKAQTADVAGNDDFVIPKESAKAEPSRDRVHIEPDSDVEQAAEENNEWHPARSSSNTKDDAPEERKYTPPPEIPDSMVGHTPPPPTPGESQLRLGDTNYEDQADGADHDQDATPTRARTDKARDLTNSKDGDSDDNEATRGPAPNDARQSSLLSMDYLRHPGSGPTPPKKGGTDEDRWDLDCLRSPYSVD